MSIIMFAGSIAFITSIIGLLPQVFKAFKTKSTQDISMMMIVNFIVCSVAWIIYGAYTDSGFVLVSNVVGLVTALILVFQKRFYDAR